MASYTNNNVNPLSKALNNSYPGNKPLSTNNGAVLQSGQFNGQPSSQSIDAARNMVAGTKPAGKSTSPVVGQAMKKQVTTQPNGLITETHYYDTQTGGLTSEGKAAGKQEVKQPTSTVNTGSQGTTDSQGHNTSSWPETPPAQDPVTSGGLYSQYTQQLANQNNSLYNQTAQKNIENLSQTAGGNQQYADRAKQIADAAGAEISDIGKQTAQGEAGHLSKGTSPVAQGMAGLISRTGAAQQQAVSQGANMQLAGNAQGLQAQGQAQSGYGNAASQAFTGQGQSQSGLSTALGATAPILSSYGQANYNPISGNTGGGEVQSNDPFYKTLQGYAQQAANGQIANIPSSITSNPVLNNQLNQMAKEINPQYNPLTSSAQGSALVSNTGDVLTQINTLDTNKPAFDANASQLSDFAAQGGLSKDVPIFGALSQKFGTSFANNPTVAGFLAKINSVNQLYQQITGVQGTLDPEKMTVDGLNTAVRAMQDDITNKRNALNDQKNKLSRGATSNTSTSSGITGYKNGGAF